MIESTPKQILVVGKYYPPYFGGIELVTKQCVETLQSRFSITVICYNTKNHTEVWRDKNLTIVRCATPFSAFRQPVSFLMGWWILGSRADLIHFHAPNFWGAALLLLLKPRGRLLITHHADVEGRKVLKSILMPLYNLLLYRATKVVVSSLKNHKLSTDLRCNVSKVVEIPFGLDPNLYVSNQKQKSRAAKNRSIIFGFCGRLVWYKGVDVLITAFSRLCEGQLWILGDGPLRSELEAMVKEMGVIDRVFFYGRVSEERKIKLMLEMDVFVLPSTHVTETFGIAQMEAQMCGVPCISSNLPTGVSDIVDPDVTGLLVEPGNIVKLHSAMQRMIDEPDFRQRCGRAARVRATRLFSENVFKTRYLDLVSNILDSD